MLVLRIVNVVFDVYLLGLLVFVFSSWIRHPFALDVRRRLEPFFEPLLKPIRNILGSYQMGRAQLDISPIILFFVLALVRNLVLRILIGPFLP